MTYFRMIAEERGGRAPLAPTVWAEAAALLRYSQLWGERGYSIDDSPP